MQSWFSDAGVVRLPAVFGEVGLGFTAPVSEERSGGRVHMSDPDDGMFKNRDMASCGTGLSGECGVCECVCMCVPVCVHVCVGGGWGIEQFAANSSLSHVVNQSAGTPGKE